jgi:hypothetical protein
MMARCSLPFRRSPFPCHRLSDVEQLSEVERQVHLSQSAELRDRIPTNSTA